MCSMFVTKHFLLRFREPSLSSVKKMSVITLVAMIAAVAAIAPQSADAFIFGDLFDRASDAIDMSGGFLSSGAGELTSAIGRLGPGDRCNATTPCATANDVCQATPAGNRCVPPEMVPCRNDQECGGGSTCFLPNGAISGYCGGCEDDASCTQANITICLKPGQFPYGRCVQCTEDVACNNGTDQFCDTVSGSTLNQLQDSLAVVFQDGSSFLSGLFNQAKLTTTGRSKRHISSESHGFPTFTCMPKRESGQACHRDMECLSDDCDTSIFKKDGTCR